MEGRRGDRGRMKRNGATSVRASISFPPDIYEALDHIAKKKKVSMAWVVRDAVERYVADHEEQMDAE